MNATRAYSRYDNRPVKDKKPGFLDKPVYRRYAKYALYVGIGIGAVWASKYVFMALAGSVKAFKGLSQAIKE